jgi:phage pi2 protein 07
MEFLKSMRLYQRKGYRNIELTVELTGGRVITNYREGEEATLVIERMRKFIDRLEDGFKSRNRVVEKFVEGEFKRQFQGEGKDSPVGLLRSNEPKKE